VQGWAKPRPQPPLAPVDLGGAREVGVRHGLEPAGRRAGLTSQAFGVAAHGEGVNVPLLREVAIILDPKKCFFGA
jgi:hypothetical protein